MCEKASAIRDQLSGF